MDRRYLPLLLLLFGFIGCHTMTLDSGTTRGDAAEGLFAKTSKLFRPAHPDEPRPTPLPASLHVPSSSLNASQLLYDFGPPDAAEEPPKPKVAAKVADSALEGPLKPRNDDSPKFRSLLVEIEATPPENLRISIAETEKKIAQFRDDQKNHRSVWLENPQIESQYLASLREMILPSESKSKESGDHETVASRREPVRRPPPVRNESADSLLADDDDDDFVPAPMPPPKRQKKELSATAPAPYPSVTQLEQTSPTVTKNDIVQAAYTAESPGGDWQTQARMAADLLRAKIANTPDGRSFTNEANLRLLELVLGNRQEAVRPFAQVERPINDFWSNQMLGFSTLLDEDAIPDKQNRLATASFRFDEGANELRRLCPMKLKNVQLVKDWVTFGVFLPRKEDCQAGETVGLYLELDNPTVKRSAMGYTVRPTIHYEIRDSASKLVSRSKDIPLEETTPSQKRDYCIHLTVELPKGLAHGQYLLRVSVTDMNSDNLQYAEEQLSLRVLPSAKAYPDE